MMILKFTYTPLSGTVQYAVRLVSDSLSSTAAGQPKCKALEQDVGGVLAVVRRIFEVREALPMGRDRALHVEDLRLRDSSKVSNQVECGVDGAASRHLATISPLRSEGLGWPYVDERSVAPAKEVVRPQPVQLLGLQKRDRDTAVGQRVDNPLPDAIVPTRFRAEGGVALHAERGDDASAAKVKARSEFEDATRWLADRTALRAYQAAQRPIGR